MSNRLVVDSEGGVLEVGVTLTSEEASMLGGECGAANAKAMEIVVALARVYGASNLVPVHSSQIAGVSFENLGDAGLEFLMDWRDAGARVRVPSTLNPAGMDLDGWQKLGIPREFAHKQLMVVKVYESMGIRPTCTCTPNAHGFIDHGH